MEGAQHEPVMLAETLSWLAPAGGQTILDATVGLGGHALEILRRLGPEGRLIGLDRDPEALRTAEPRLRQACADWVWSRCPILLAHSNFRDLDQGLAGLDLDPSDSFHGCLFDLGVSSMQLDRPERGFSFRADGPLDMRMDPTTGPTAADLVNHLGEDALGHLFRRFGEERYAFSLAKKIVARRPFATTRELEEVIWLGVPEHYRRGRIHPATRVFQALRIAVNEELCSLDPALLAAAARLAPGGRLVVLSYHSLEDGIVKRTFRYLAGHCRCALGTPLCQCGARELGRVLTRKPQTPSPAEVDRNPRARSARLRCLERNPV